MQEDECQRHLVSIGRDMNDTRATMASIMSGVLERGDKLAALTEKSNSLSVYSQNFSQATARQLRRQKIKSAYFLVFLTTISIATTILLYKNWNQR